MIPKASSSLRLVTHRPTLIMIYCPLRLIRSLKALKLYGMAQTISELADQSSPAFIQAQSTDAEVAEREVRSINRIQLI